MAGIEAIWWTQTQEPCSQSQATTPAVVAPGLFRVPRLGNSERCDRDLEQGVYSSEAYVS